MLSQFIFYFIVIDYKIIYIYIHMSYDIVNNIIRITMRIIYTDI
jgi:hypothetical protein